jgi:hypothetical protein
MFDIYTRSPSGNGVPIVRNAEFFRIELASLADGMILVFLTATTVDEDEPQLLDQEIASERVATLDDLLALIRQHVQLGIRPAAALPSQLS